MIKLYVSPHLNIFRPGLVSVSATLIPSYRHLAIFFPDSRKAQNQNKLWLLKTKKAMTLFQHRQLCHDNRFAAGVIKDQTTYVRHLYIAVCIKTLITITIKRLCIETSRPRCLDHYVGNLTPVGVDLHSQMHIAAIKWNKLYMLRRYLLWVTSRCACLGQGVCK